MMRVLVIAAVTAVAATAFAVWVYEGEWGEFGFGNGQFRAPYGIAVATNGNVYVAGVNNDRIQYFTANGSFLGQWGARGAREGQFQRPTDVAVTPNANVFVTDRGNNRIQYFTPTGSFLGTWGGGNLGPYGGGVGAGLIIYGLVARTEPVYAFESGERLEPYDKGGIRTASAGFRRRSVKDRGNAGRFLTTRTGSCSRLRTLSGRTRRKCLISKEARLRYHLCWPR